MLHSNPVLASLQVFEAMGLPKDVKLGPEYRDMLYALVELRKLLGDKRWGDLLPTLATPPNPLPKFLTPASIQAIWTRIDGALNIIYTENSNES